MKTRSANGKLKAVQYVEEDAKESGEDDGDALAYEDTDTSDDEPRPTKRRRQSRGNTNQSPKLTEVSTSKSKGKEKAYRGRNVGKLAKLLEMPVDIFCEITVYLEPLDLLRLARSTRGFNQMLMSRNSKPIWRTARNYFADLPDCPSDLSEPEYARLLFERDCHACLAPRVLKVDYVLRARLCHRCRSSYILKGTQLIKIIPDLTEELLECIPCRNMGYADRRHRRLEYFYSGQVEALVTKYRATVPHDLSKEHARTLQKEFFDRQKQSIADILQHAKDVDKWLLSDRITKNQKASEAIERRRDGIYTKLIKLGYDESDFPERYTYGSSEWNQILDQPRDLTPRIWATIRPKLEACIERVKTTRDNTARNLRKSCRRAELQMHVGPILADRKLRSMELCMHLNDVLELPSVKALFSEDDYQHQITEVRWETARGQIEREMNEYADRAREGLMRLVIASHQTRDPALSSESCATEAEINVDVDVAFLLLATTLFRCTRCRNLLRYPALLDHFHGWPTQWKLADFTFDTAASPTAKSLLSSLKQPEDENIFGSERRLQCLRCDENISKPMNWVDLVLHFTEEQAWYDNELLYQQSKPSSDRVALHNDHALTTESPMVAVLNCESATAQREKVHAWSAGELWNSRCRLCEGMGPVQPRKRVVLHLSTKHLKDHPEEGDIATSVR